MGPLHGVKVIELAGIGPAPFCAMMLADMGADVIRVDRVSARPGSRETDCLLRNRRSIALDLKHPAAIEALLELVAGADALIEGFRPGVMERLGLGPDVCLARNARLVYGRMTGWGQMGPLAHAAGHDINYIALAGALHLIGERGRRPVPPLNLVGDFGGGAMMLLAGVLAALFEAARSGKGQVVDAAMTDGTVALLGIFFSQRATYRDFQDVTGGEMLAGAAPYYGTYETRDGKYLAIGAIEPQFYALLLERLGLDPKYLAAGFPASRTGDDDVRAAIAAAVRTRTRDEWAAVFEGTDACVAPVLSLAEAATHPHNVARGTFVTVDGVEQHAPAPRFSRTAASPIRPPRAAGADTAAVLQDIGFSEQRIAELRAAGALT
ncbi:MAG TPA: CaiB/BaiF CoA-transferase family protein [Steroidobacteraceae bacterium]